MMNWRGRWPLWREGWDGRSKKRSHYSNNSNSTNWTNRWCSTSSSETSKLRRIGCGSCRTSSSLNALVRKRRERWQRRELRLSKISRGGCSRARPTSAWSSSSIRKNWDWCKLNWRLRKPSKNHKSTPQRKKSMPPHRKITDLPKRSGIWGKVSRPNGRVCVLSKNNWESWCKRTNKRKESASVLRGNLERRQSVSRVGASSCVSDRNS